jgi:hypothetical protein
MPPKQRQVGRFERAHPLTDHVPPHQKSKESMRRTDLKQFLLLRVVVLFETVFLGEN